ncbi:enoyl-CoA hydratase [Amycolatopsis bartoniae]|uniref:Enoyl CoA dehydratase/isomerase n=1 Tax=Amycolatopsis bartoniae TaxID=941986 RepID=A0A8H9ME75_9PSEU|nr:crotonase/enoyl-CoA hydratase family protein [Amycolatopsis bartoniae]MBB2938574.1 enoyl-CoA hydratase [Amycolatopsis bartoniae]TVT08922.1 crotonase/enoyl-CoA hydratase family protein [Amycolatopsis bartoniae]GHF70028.1 enoyl CoA dehydratase/isomerase [Amycolatopsis bartoniae]
MSDEVLVGEQDRVLVITINRPRARNAVNAAVATAVNAALERLAERDDLLAGVLTGAGGTFCAGMDLKAYLRGETVVLPGLGLAGLTQRRLAKPMIAAVEGYALAGGCELALACDLIVAADNAWFGIPEVKRGLVAAAGGLLRLPSRMPYQLAMEYALTGDPFDATVAHRHGMVNRLTEPGGALDAAMALARRIIANAPLAVRASKAVVSLAPGWSADEAFDRQEELVRPVFASEDAREGARAFAEKRDPVWRDA